MTNILLSICIPTRDRIDILKNTLNSIFNSNVDLSDFEVVIYDSSENNKLNEIIFKNFKYPNLIYKKGENKGFLNLITALQMGKGSFLKLHNDYTTLIEGSLERMIKLVKFNLGKKPLMFFANGSLKYNQDTIYSSFDSFLFNVSYFSTWSTAFGIWKSDFDEMNDVFLNHMFPHTSLLFASNGKNAFLINNELLYSNQIVANKGGYDLFKTFAVDYLDMLFVCLKNSQISKTTFEHIKHDLFKNFIINWYYITKIRNNDYTFDLSNIKKSMQVHYSTYAYYNMVMLGYIKALKKLLNKSMHYIRNNEA